MFKWHRLKKRNACNEKSEIPDPSLAANRNYGLSLVINIGVGKDVTIKELAELVKQAVGYGGEIICDPSKPDVTP